MEQSHEIEVAEQSTAPPSLPAGALIRSGVAWNGLYQVYASLIAFGSMLLLVRILPPREYGRASAVVSLLTLLNTFNCRQFIAHALQLPGDVEPDWSQHFAVALRVQAVLSLLCHAVAGACWFLPAYRTLAPLLHIAGIGLLFDSASQLGSTMLARAMNFRRMRVIGAVGTLVTTAVTLGFGFTGFGALAIVLANNLVGSLPFAVDLFLVRRWRPQHGWWVAPRWRDYWPSMKFGAVQIASASLTAARSGLEFAILPVRVGFPNIGLWSRAQALFTISAGRVLTVLQQTVYPLLPRYAAQRESYPRYATQFAQVMVWLAVPAAIFVGFEGRALSRIVYGTKWIAADPMIWPGTLLGLGFWLFTVASIVQFAANRLRICLQADIFAACMGLPALAVALLGGGIVAYAWAFAGGQMLAAIVNGFVAERFLHAGWGRNVYAPAILSSAAGALGIVLIQRLGLRLPVQVLFTATAHAALVAGVLRFAYPAQLSAVLVRLPAGARLQRILRLAPIV